MMTYEDIPLLGRYDRVLVTGPQRSGTQIAGRIIARILGYEFRNWKSWLSSINGLMSFLATEKVVWQNPSMVGITPFLRDNGYRVAVVFVWRNLEDINRSIERIGWSGDKDERSRLSMPKHQITPSAVRKQQMWLEWEPKYESLLTLPYECLAVDPDWVEKPDRTGWKSDQTKEDER